MKPESEGTDLPTFTTERLRIRPLDRGDAEAIFAIQSDPRVTERYCAEPYKTVEETRKWLEDRMAERHRRQSMFWVFTLKDRDAAIGSCCFWNPDWNSNRVEIGYELRPEYWNQGIMSEGIPPILDYGFRDLELHRVEACPFSENTASSRLLLKLGFKQEGEMRQRYLFRARYFDQLWFALLKEDWEARQPH